MTATDTTITGTLTKIIRRGNTAVGNPRFTLHLTTTAGVPLKLRTRDNSAVSYVVDNYRDGTHVVLTLTPAGTVCGIDYDTTRACAGCGAEIGEGCRPWCLSREA